MRSRNSRNNLRPLYEDQDKIMTRFAKNCTYSHNSCRDIQTQILKLHNYGGQVDNNFLTTYLIYLSSYRPRCCLSLKDNWLEAVTVICKNIVPTLDNLSTIIEYGQDDQRVMKLIKSLIERGEKLSSSVLKKALEFNSLILAGYLLNHVSLDSECLEIACKFKNTDKMINNILARGVRITTEALNNAVTSGNFMVPTLIEMNAKPDIKTLELACRNNDRDNIKTLLQCKINPTKECFKAVLEPHGYPWRSDTYGYPVRYSRKFKEQQVAEIIDIIILYGYKIDYEDVILALSKGFYINDIHRFDLDLGSDFLEKCTYYNYHPYDIDIKPTSKCLEIECGRTGNLKAVKELISKGAEPNIECLRTACKNKSNKPTIEYLVEKHGLVPDIKCIKNNAEYINNVTLKYILSKIPDDDEKLNKNASNSKKKNLADEDKLEYIDDLDINTENEQGKGKKIKTKILEDEEETDQKITKLEPPYSVPNNSVSNNSVPNNKRKKGPVPNRILKFFGKEPKTKLSFIDLRKLLIAYVKNNKLLDKENKSLIKIDKKLGRLVKLKQGSLINYSDLDYLVSLLYQC